MNQTGKDAESQPVIHFISGFLGSGKTTAIVQLCRLLVEEGYKTAVVTNDQGRYQVDKAFVESARIPSTAVAEGCFCCRYDDFEEKVLSLSQEARPDVIFAESVGSCADVIATVVKPFRNFRGTHAPPGSLSTFTDIRMLEARLDNRDLLPFSDNVLYIFDKQIEEAEVLIVNKADLVEGARADALLSELDRRYPEKEKLLISALEEMDVRRWWHLISSRAPVPSKSLASMDYEIYGAGEQMLSWLDARSRMTPGTKPEDRPGSEDEPEADGIAPLTDFVQDFSKRLLAEGAAIGHIKLSVEDADGRVTKASVTGMDEPPEHGLRAQLPDHLPLPAKLLFNARVMTDTETLEKLYEAAVSQMAERYGVQLRDRQEDIFVPGFPEPLQRLE